MLRNKKIDRICAAITVAALLFTVLFMFGENLGIEKASAVPEYASRLLNDSKVHRIDIQMEEWNKFLETAPEEKYWPVTLIIDGERFEQAGLRAKGNNSKNLVEKYGSERYSLKVEMDHYIEGRTYYGLDKFSLDAAFQDNSYLKNYMVYDMMDFIGVPAPLCSYCAVTVNGQAWGLFLAVEEPEEAFAKRNFGMRFGQLYKPDYRSLKDENADIALRYKGETFDAYDNIFRNAKFETDDGDKNRLIRALEILYRAGSGEATRRELEDAVYVEEVLRYFVVQVFVVNLDSYLGKTGHNYFLYEEGGRIQILPWDYNLAFGTYSLGMPDPVNDAGLYINYPIDTPASGDVMTKRPLFHHLLMQEEYYQEYHRLFEQWLADYFGSGYFHVRIEKVRRQIAPFVREDPTAFCSYEDFQLGVDTLKEFCLLRAESAGLQLEGRIPSTIRGQSQEGGREHFVNASSVWLPDMGEIADLKD